jgi:hypothetical protein
MTGVGFLCLSKIAHMGRIRIAMPGRQDQIAKASACLVSRCSGAHMHYQQRSTVMLATVHFVLSVAPAQRHEGRLKGKGRARLREIVNRKLYTS